MRLIIVVLFSMVITGCATGPKPAMLPTQPGCYLQVQSKPGQNQAQVNVLEIGPNGKPTESQFFDSKKTSLLVIENRADGSATLAFISSTSYEADKECFARLKESFRLIPLQE